MGLFDFLKGKPAPAEMTFPVTLGAAAKGSFVAMAEIPDMVFSTGVLGICCGIDPDEGKVFAPVDGKISHILLPTFQFGNNNIPIISLRP